MPYSRDKIMHMKGIRWLSIAKLKAFYARYERYLIPGALIVGIVGDFVTFRVINTESAFILLTVHSILAGLAIFLLNFYKEVDTSEAKAFIRYTLLATPLVLQFSFGALLSASLVFYWFSGAFAVSWPLFAGLLILMIGNDVFRDYYQMAKVQIPIYYFALFSFSSVALPYLTNSIDPGSFVLAGIISLIVISGYVFLTSQILPEFQSSKRYFGISILSIYIAMNLLYFFNFIPPIPLSITDMGVYENVERREDIYIVTKERQNIFERLLPGTKITIAKDDPLYLFSSIFAPTDLNTTIVHDWEFYNEVQKKWVNSSDIRFQLIGGRSDGYRGYTFKQNHTEGKWRVTVRTERGQALGRLVFKVIYSDGEIQKVEEVK